MNANGVMALLTVLVLSAMEARAGFSDDFSNEAASNTNWVAANDGVKRQFSNGACTVTNSDTVYAGMVYHTFTADQRKSEFTLSGSITLGGDGMSAGFVCCLSLSGNGPGYYIAMQIDGNVTVTKIPVTGAGQLLLSVRCPYIKSGANGFKVSKKGDLFNIFCNGYFIAKFNDTTLGSGDIALLVSPKTTAVFDDILMTDTFEEGVPPSCFADDFNNGLKAGWSSFGDEGVASRIDGDALRITTGDGKNRYMVVDLPLSQFVMKVIVSQLGGGTQKLYGLFICGTSSGGGSIPLAGFGINGGRSYGAFSAGQNLTLTPSTAIKGAPYVSSAGESTFYRDTLEVIKRNGSAEYLFVVNGDTLTRFTGVNFDITGAGMFCLDSLDIAYDDFTVAEGTTGECPVRHSAPALAYGGPRRSPGMTDVRLFDLSGRMVARDYTSGRVPAVSGIYLRRDAGKPVHRLRDR